MLNIGHRGAMGHAPENTLASVQIALDLGVDWIEIDVYSVEETAASLVVIHDDTLERTTNGAGNVMDVSFDYLRTLDAGGGEKIPTMAEVFALVDRRVGINVELKGPNTAVPTITFLQTMLNKGWQLDQLLLSSFDHAQLLTAKATDPRFPRAALYDDTAVNFPFVTQQLEAVAVNPYYKNVTAELVNDAHQHNLKVYPYTVNEIADMQKMQELGVDGIFTNYPDRLKKLSEQ